MKSAKVIVMSPPAGFLEDMERLFDEFVASKTNPVQEEEPAADNTPSDNMADALAQFGEIDYKSYPSLSAKYAPKPKLSVVEKALAEEALLKHPSHAVRQSAADDLVNLAQEEGTTIPTACRIRDMLSFWNTKSGGEEFAPYLRLVKHVISLKIQSKEKEAEELRKFETRKTPPYAPDFPKNQPRQAVIITKPKSV